MGSSTSLLTTLFMVAEALGLAIGILIFLTFLGLGLTELLLPKAEGFGPLLAPAVGLAVLTLSFQWLTFLLPPYLVAVIVLLALGPLTVVVAWRRRSTLLERWRDLLGAGLLTLAFYCALLQMVFVRGFFTLGGLASDNVFIYVQAAQYLRDHPMPSALHAVSQVNPGSSFLVTTGLAFPNSVGPIDAAVSILSGWPVHTVFDPINALSLALTIGPVWFLVRVGLGGSWWTGSAAAALLATNQLMYWLGGNGFQQECQALPVYLAGLALTAHALRSESPRAGSLAGIVAGALPGLYLPIASVFAICATGCTLVHLAIGPPAHRMRLLRPLGCAVVSGVASAGAALYILLFQGGLEMWLFVVGARVPAGSVSKLPAFSYLVGTLPFANVWEQTLLPLGRHEALFFPALVAVSAGVVALLLIGHIRAALHQHAPEAALLTAGMLFVAYEASIARYPYGFVKSIGYLVPLTSAFVGFGALGLGSPGARRSFSAAVRALGVIALVIVLAASTLASRDMVRPFADGAPSFTRSDLSLSSLTSAVPVGASVFVDDPTDDYRTLVKVAAVTYFLPDRQVRVFTGSTRVGSFPEQDVRPPSCRFDYVIGPDQPDGDFMLVDSDPEAQLNLYKRLGVACS